MKKMSFLFVGAIFSLALLSSLQAADKNDAPVPVQHSKTKKEAVFTNKEFSGKRFSGPDESGAVIKMNGGELVVTGCIFTDNGGSVWSSWGGAIAGADHEKAKVTISDSSFINNVARYGGAMSMIGKDAEITLTDVTFRDNHALATRAGIGGAIHLQCPGIRFIYRVSEKKTIVNSGNTATHGGFLHTHNGDVALVFDVGNKGKLVIGKEGAKTDSIDLTRGTTFRKIGAGTMIVNAPITQDSPYGGQTKVEGSDFVVEKGTLQLTHSGQIKGIMEVFSGGYLIIPSGCTVEHVIVRKGGRLLVEEGGTVSNLEEEKGAHVKTSEKTSSSNEKKDGPSKRKDGNTKKQNRD